MSRCRCALRSFRPELLVADTSLGTPPSWLMDQAVRRGCKTVDGLALLIEQIAVALRALDRRRAQPPGPPRRRRGVFGALSS